MHRLYSFLHEAVMPIAKSDMLECLVLDVKLVTLRCATVLETFLKCLFKEVQRK
jgi:hypothetical protein